MKQNKGCKSVISQFGITLGITIFLLMLAIGFQLRREGIGIGWLYGWVFVEQDNIVSPVSSEALPDPIKIAAKATVPTEAYDSALAPQPLDPELPVFQAAELAVVALHSRATRLVIPALELDASVVKAPIVGDTWEVSHLAQQVGHLERTADPGSHDNVVLAAHVTLAPDGQPGPFAGLHTLTPGDLVTVYAQDQPFTYQIEQLKTVKPTAVEVSYPSSEPRLTLITSLNYNAALAQYEDRLVAVGYLVSVE